MKIKEIEIDGITYTVRSSTKAGLKKAISQFKRSLKKSKQKPNNNETEGHGV
jgi:hypothetical protein